MARSTSLVQISASKCVTVFTGKLGDPNFVHVSCMWYIPAKCLTLAPWLTFSDFCAFFLLYSHLKDFPELFWVFST